MRHLLHFAMLHPQAQQALHVVRVSVVLLLVLPLFACQPPAASPAAGVTLDQGLAGTAGTTERVVGLQSVGVPVFDRGTRDPGRAVRFEHLTVEDGLSQNAVLFIIQDQRGLMWFATEDGLNRYDGYEFTVYKHDPDDPGSLGDSFVSALCEDRNGGLWLGTRSGLDRLNRTTGTFDHYRHDPANPGSLGAKWIVSVYEDREGTLWVGTEDNGLDRLDPATGNFEHYRHDPADPTSLSNNTVRLIYEDQAGNLWLGTNGGLNRMDRANGTFQRYRHDPTDPHSLSNDQVWTILEDAKGSLWVGTDGGGLNRFDPATGEFVRYQHNPLDPHSLSHDRVRALVEDRAGRLWVGTQNGLDQFDRQEGHFIHFRHDPYDAHSLSSSSIWSMYEDRAGVLWFGSYGGGLSKYNRATDRFVLYQHNPNLPNTLSDDMVWAIHEDREGGLWIGTFNGGLNRLDRDTGTFAVYRNNPSNPASLANDDVRAILQDREGVLWIGTSGGLDRFEPQTGTFVHYRNDPNNPRSLSENRVTVLHEDQQGNLWVGTRIGGLNRLDRATGTFKRYWYDPNDPNSLSENRIWAIYGDRSGKLWVGTLGGINVWDPATDRFTHYTNDPSNPQSLANDSVFSFYEDSQGFMWVGTWGGGLDRLDPATGIFTPYTEKNGLPNNVIYGIEADRAGYLWLSTNRGVSRFDPRSETFRNYDASDGLQNNEFNVGAHSANASEVFLGGISGFNILHPASIIDNPVRPPILVTAFRKLNQVVRADLVPGEQIHLSYSDNLISFEFAALDYTAPEKNQYAYMLEGQDRDWVYAGTRRHADYTNLRGGQYVFRVKGSNSDGVWNEEGVAIPIVVTPPVWEMWWFRGTAVLLLAGVAVGGYRLRMRSIQRQNRALENLVRQRTHALEALNAIASVVSRSLNLQEVMEAALDKTLEVMDMELGVAYRLEAGDGSRPEAIPAENLYLDPMVYRGLSEAFYQRVQHLPIGGTMTARAMTTGRPVVWQVDECPQVWLRAAFKREGVQLGVSVPLLAKGKLVGALFLGTRRSRPVLPEEEALLAAIGQQIGIAVENAHLYAQAEESAAVAERHRLARDLHDAVTQTLFSASLIAEVVPKVWEANRDKGREQLDKVRLLTRGALAEMRTLLLELRPEVLIEADLGELLRQLGEAMTGRSGVPVTLHTEGHCKVPPPVQVAFYRIAQEALNNISKHADASQVAVSLRCEPDRVTLSVADDGRGFDPTDISAGHLGVGIMHERAQAVGAQLQVDSEIGHGTTVKVDWRSDDGRMASDG